MRTKADTLYTKLKIVACSDHVRLMEVDRVNHHNVVVVNDADTTKIIIPSHVKYIRAYSLDKINHRKNVQIIGGEGLVQVTNPHWLDSTYPLNCVDLTEFNTINLMEAQYLFYGMCTETLLLGNFKAPKLKDVTAMFRDVTISSTLDIGFLSNTDVEELPQLFKNSDIECIKADTLNYRRITSMSEMFYNTHCRGHIILGDLGNANGLDMKSMFEGCNIQELTMNFYKPNILRIERIFNNARISRLNTNSIDVKTLYDAELKRAEEEKQRISKNRQITMEIIHRLKQGE